MTRSIWKGPFVHPSLLKKIDKLKGGTNKKPIKIFGKSKGNSINIIDAQFKSDVLQFLNSKVVQIEKQIELQPANTAEEKENKEFALKLFDFVQAKLEQKDDADNTLTVPKSMIKKK